jgi:hypothetical protein
MRGATASAHATHCNDAPGCSHALTMIHDDSLRAHRLLSQLLLINRNTPVQVHRMCEGRVRLAFNFPDALPPMQGPAVQPVQAAGPVPATTSPVQ